MQKLIILSLSLLLIISSCKLKDPNAPTVTPVDPSTQITITVISPNGGEIASEGSSLPIQWTGTGTKYVRIAFTYDNGSSWGLIVDSLSNTGVYTWFPVPNRISNQCKIRVSSVDGQTSDESDKVFSIVRNSNESLRIISPIGGESWEAGTAKQIKWFSSGLDSVKLEYTTNNGQKWNLIAVDKKNTGIYYWEPVPNTPSTLAKVRIMDAKDGNPLTESPAAFQILPEPIVRVISPNGGEKILAGTSRKIEWLSENIPNVKIAFTTNNGFDWVTIVPSTPATGFYVWNPVPNINSQLCKVRVYDASDGEPSDVSDSVFTITTQVTQTLEVTSPNGGERWQAGTNQNITWSSSGIQKVKIEFTSNNGLTWNTITNDLPNTGAYEWNVPNSLSTQCLVRVSDAADGAPIDQSNALFRIVPKPELKILYPNGGETWTGGVIDTIRWSSVGVDNVMLEYTPDNGKTWTTIVEKIPSSGKYGFSFTVAGTQYRIRITDADNKSPQALSNGTFTVTEEPKITVVSPNGKEEWYAGSSNTIRWNSINIENVKIELTTNNGASWITIVTSTPSTGSYNWSLIPNINSLQCRVRISEASRGLPSDISNDNFTITNPGTQLIKVTKPNGSEVFPAGTSQDITWEAAGISNVRIEYTINNGINWNLIVASTPSTGYYKWSQVPNTPATNCKIRITDAADGVPSDESDQFFVITSAPSIKVLIPNGNDTWISGTTKEINWTSENVEYVKIEFTINGGATWTTITSSTLSTGSYFWSSIPSVNSLQCKIRISDAVYGTPSDMSDDNFAIMNPGSQQIKVTSPNGGENWPAGSSQRISWDAGGIANVRIEYTINNGITWNTIIANTPSNGFYVWNQIPNTPATNCKIRISDASDGIPSDESDLFFSITPAPSVKVLIPNGNDTWVTSTTKEIKWSSENVENVKIEFTTNGGGTWITIVTSTPSSGSYMWLVPDANNSLQCKIKISDALNGSPSDISDDNFAIMRPGAQQLKLVSPNGGENWNVGSMQNITWDAGGIANVKLEFTTNNGNTWEIITSNTPSNGYYTWNPVPNTPGTNCRVRISDAADNDPTDMSDGMFSILPAPSIKVVSPNGGEVIQYNTTTEIQWTSENVMFVKIEYTTNGGASWNVITNSVESIGTYSWKTVPNISSKQCRIRISDAANGTSSDISDNNFEITNAIIKSIKVISPNGGEKWEAGSVQNITWNASNVNSVTIELSTNQGSAWTLLADTVSGGAYQWSIATTLNSVQCQIRIRDKVDNTISDVSDANFTIEPRKYIYVTQPSGNPTFKDSDPVTIEWESSGISYVGIKYTTTNGAGHYPDIPAFYPLVEKMPNEGKYVTSFSLPSQEYYVVVYNADNETLSPSARSIGKFTVIKTDPVQLPSVTLLAPNGGEEWLTSDPANNYSFEIRWRSVNVDSVDIFYSLNGGASWKTIATKIPSNGLYNWTTPTQVDFRSDNCLMKIVSSKNTTVADQSDGYFSIHPQTKLLRWLFPNGGEYIHYPDTEDPITDTDTLITWHSAGIYLVNIDYSSDNGLSWTNVATNYPSTGAYNWDLATIPLASTNGRMRITDVSADAGTPPLVDLSDNVFNMHILPAGRIDYFNDPIKIKPNQSKNITWFSPTDISNALIEYSADEGKTWTAIQQNVKSKANKKNEFVWKAPNKTLEKVIVRVRSDLKELRRINFSVKK
jgi:hypothetical protein